MVSANSAESHARIFMKLKYLTWFPLSQLEIKKKTNSSQNKAISMKDDSSTL